MQKNTYISLKIKIDLVIISKKMVKKVVNDKFALKWLWPYFVVGFQRISCGISCVAVDFFGSQGFLELV